MEKKITKLRTFLISKNGKLMPVDQQEPVIKEKKQGFFGNLFTTKKGGKHSIKRKTKNRKNKKQKTKKFNRRK